VVTGRRILVILDGAPEPVQPWPTTLEAAATPALDALCVAGEVGRVATTPEHHAPGSETGIPAILGALPPAGQVARGPVEAAAAGVVVPAGMGAWRLDVRHRSGARATDHEVHLLWPLLRSHLPRHCVMPLRGHRVLALGPRRPVLRRCAGMDITVWADGARLTPALDASTTMVCGPGAAAGIGRLLGARVIVPDETTGDVDTDLDAKAVAALHALERGGDVVVHVGAADEAAHRGERDAKRLAIEAVDTRVIAPLRTAARAAGATIAVTSDHGTCPWTGRHDPAPVPYVLAGPGVTARGPRRLTERAVAGAGVDDPAILRGAGRVPA
jgi:2,3-bisphosphoglycerate-independent phosphoglycerate mutase